MFRKLVSNLPFNPSLLGQLGFYAQRIKQEETLRRFGFGFMALAMFIQMFAVVAPPEKSLAYSSDYIINGLRNRDDILRAWDGQTSDRNVAEIYGRFGLTRADIQALPMQPNVTIRSDAADYWTMGRTSLSAVSKAGQIKQQYKNSEVAVNTGGTTIYLRQLKAWDIANPVNTYRAFEGTKNGKKFWILVDCGNLTQVGKPPILKTPALQFRKTIDGGPQTLKPGDTFKFRFEYRNSVAESQPAENVVLHDEFDTAKFDIVSSTPTIKMIGNGRQIALSLGNVGYTSNYQTALVVTARLKQGLANGTKACNAAKLTASNATEVWSGGSGLCVTANTPAPKPVDVCPNIAGDQATVPANKIKDSNGNCVDPSTPDVCPNIAGSQPTVPAGKVKDGNGNCVDPPEPCPLDNSLTKTDPRCTPPVLACVLTNSDVNKTTKLFTLKTTVTSSDQALTTINSFVYDFGDGSAVITRKSNAYQDTITHTYKDGSYNATVVVNYTVGKGSGRTDGSASCSAAIDSNPDQPLSQEKTARNLTQNLDAAGTVKGAAKAGDTIEYTLTTHNSYDYARTNVAISDFIGDILDYATLDKAYLAQQGGTFDETAKTISWQNQTVAAGSNLAKTFRIQMKSPLPSTNQPSTMTTAYDCMMSNKFGNQLDLKVDCPLPKSAEYVTERLPNTGPGTSLVIGFTATFIITYFFARSRLLAKELDIIRTDFAQTGGV